MADQDETQALLQHSGELTVEQAIARAREEFGRFNNVVLNIAVTGESGAGKSSFVNAIRGLKNTDEGAAQTGVKQTTTEPTPYPHPTMPNVKIWDLPGIGDKTFKASTYMKDVKFQNYDDFIIVSATRFKENDHILGKEIKKNKKNFYFVRTKVDLDVSNQEYDGITEDETLQTIRDDCSENLQELESPPVFLITSRYLNRFDFQKLVEALETDLPEHKKQALILSLPVYSNQSLKKKYEIFKKRAWTVAITSGAVGGIPVPGLSSKFDIAMVASFLTKCYFSFGLDENSLTKLSDRVNKPMLCEVRGSSLVMAIAEKSTLSIKLAAKIGAADDIESICRSVPVAGNIAAAGVSFFTTLSVLLEGLNELYSVAQGD